MSSSLYNATGTMIDSSAKHIVACKVCEKYFQADRNKSPDDLHRHKTVFAMLKNEMVLNCSMRMDGTFEKHAYPAVVTTLGDDLTSEDKTDYVLFYAGYLVQIPRYFSFQGVAMTTAWATQRTGDTVGSVLIGGMITILNGDYQCFAGDLVQWYFDFERCAFDKDGVRTIHNRGSMNFLEMEKPALKKIEYKVNDDNPLKRKFETLGKEDGYETITSLYGELDDDKEKIEGALEQPYEEDLDGKARRVYEHMRYYAKTQYSSSEKKNIILPKALKPTKDRVYNSMDRIRVFGKVVNGGRPWEHIDVMISNVPNLYYL